MKILVSLAALAGLTLGLFGCSPRQETISVSNTAPKSERLGLVYGNPSIGALDAPVTVVMFQDLECGMCRYAFRELVEPLQKTTEFKQGKFRLTFAEFPLGFGADEVRLAIALKCADHQDLYAALHSYIYENPKALSNNDLKTAAASHGAKPEAFEECLKSAEALGEVRKDYLVGKTLGVNGTPTFFIGTREIGGADTFENFWTILSEELARDHA